MALIGKGERKDPTARERRDPPWSGWPWADHSLYGEAGGPGCSFRSCQPLGVFSAKSNWREMFQERTSLRKTSQLAFSLGFWRTGHHEVHLVLISDALNYQTWFFTNCSFSLRNLMSLWDWKLQQVNAVFPWRDSRRRAERSKGQEGGLCGLESFSLLLWALCLEGLLSLYKISINSGTMFCRICFNLDGMGKFCPYQLEILPTRNGVADLMGTNDRRFETQSSKVKDGANEQCRRVI